MHVALFDQRTLTITGMGSHYDRLSALPGASYDKPSKALHVPLCHLRRIVEMCPGVTVDRRCVFARLDLWRRWVRQFNSMGIWFCLAEDGETVTATGEGLSPVFLEAVAARSAILRQFLGDQVLPVDAPAPVRTVEPTAGDELIWNGIVNAGRAAEKREEVVERAKAKRWTAKAEQLSLLED